MCMLFAVLSAFRAKIAAASAGKRAAPKFACSWANAVWTTKFLLQKLPSRSGLGNPRECTGKGLAAQLLLLAESHFWTLLQELATNIFSTSIVPYSAFLYWLTKSKKTPPLALFGFYFLLVFVFATIPAGVIGKTIFLPDFWYALPALYLNLVLEPKHDSCSTQSIP